MEWEWGGIWVDTSKQRIRPPKATKHTPTTQRTKPNQTKTKRNKTQQTDDVSRNRLGAYLVLSQLQAVCHSSTLFLTAAAQNLLCLQLAEAAGVDLGNHFLVWAQGAVAPALVGTVVAPNLVYLLQPPTVTETPEAPRMAAERLERLGPLSRDEAATVAAVGVALALWVAGDRAGVPPPVAAMLAVALLLGAGVLDWRKDCIGGCPQAFDTMFWFGGERWLFEF